MTIPFKCTACGFSAHVEDSMGGKAGKCPKCQTVLRVPEATAERPKIVIDSKAKEVDCREKVSFFREYWILLLALMSVALVVVPMFLLWLGITTDPLWLFAVGVIGIALSLLAAALRGCLAFKRRTKDSRSAKHYRRALCAACFCLFVTACLSAHNWSVLLTLIHYVTLALSILCVVEYWMARQPRKWVRKTGLIFGVLALIVWWQFDYSVQKWKKLGREHESSDFRYVDYHRRGAELPYYRKYRQYKKGKLLPSFRSDGYMTDAGSPHGKWGWYSWDWEAKPPIEEKGHQFYWYGEEITEAEWHLKNKD